MSAATLSVQLDNLLDESRRWATLGEFTAARAHLRAAWVVLSELDGATNHGAGLTELFTGIERWRLQDDGAVADARAAVSSGDLRQPDSSPVGASTPASSPDVPRYCDDCGIPVRSGYFHVCGTDFSDFPPHTRHGR